jgi:hypothetical protein
MENEHGCTLSKSDAIITSGKSHAPLSLKFQMNEDTPELFFKNMINNTAESTIDAIIRNLFISAMGLLPP